MSQSLKTKIFEGSNFDNDSDFVEIGKLWSTYFDIFGKPSGSAAGNQNFVGLSSETQQLLSDQILKFGPDFLKTCKLWFTYFGLIGKPSKSTTRRLKFVGQSSETKKLWGIKF